MITTLTLILSLLTALLSLYLHHELTSPLHHLPGPLLARLTNLWRFLSVQRGHSDTTQLRLHRSHGPAVRLGPNFVSLSDPSLIKTIYSARDPFIKSDFYSVADTVTQGRRVQSQFTTRDEEWHDYLVRPIRGAYSMSSVLRFEERIDSTLDYLVGKLKGEYAESGGSCPINEMLHAFAVDVVGEVTFSERLGMLDGKAEVADLMRENERVLDYLGLFGQIPWLDALMKWCGVGQSSGDNMIADFAALKMKQRMQSDRHGQDEQRDFLDLFIQAEQQDTNKVDKLTSRQISWLVLNVGAGSDTTAAVLQAAVYHVARDPKISSRLTREVRSAASSIELSWKTCQQMPYLEAVVKETLRLCPSVGLPLERVVPSKGLRLPDGVTLPPGTIVGMNPRVVNRDVDTFGDSADDFIPERWLQGGQEDEEQYQTRLRRMKEADLTFGTGRRSCIGRNLAMLEIYKCIARIFYEFDVSLADSETSFTVHNQWFVKQRGPDVQLTARRD